MRRTDCATGVWASIKEGTRHPHHFCLHLPDPREQVWVEGVGPGKLPITPANQRSAKQNPGIVSCIMKSMLDSKVKWKSSKAFPNLVCHMHQPTTPINSTSSTTVIFFWKTLIQQGCLHLIKSDSKIHYNVAKYFYFNKCCFELSFELSIKSKNPKKKE